MVRKLLLAVMPLALAVAMFGAGTASADGAGAAGGVINGTGYARPGLQPTAQSISGAYTGKLTGAGVTTAHGAIAVQEANCSFTFSGTDSIAAGNGTAQGGCSGGVQTGGTVSFSCSAGSLTYRRVGSEVVVTGNCTATINGGAHAGVVTASLVFAPTSTSSAQTDFTLAGTTSLASAG